MGANSSVEKKPNHVRLGILSVARISPRAIIAPANLLDNISVDAVASRSLEKSRDFAKKHSIAKFYGTYDELLNDKDIDAVYIPLPNSLHAEWSIKAMEAGKHVLVEKPFASNEEEAQQMLQAAKSNNRILVEAFHYRYHPMAKRLKEIVESGEIGPIQHIKTSFALASYLSLVTSEAKIDDIRFQYNLAGGIMMDAGSYPINAMRWLAGKEPVEVTSAKPTIVKPQVEMAMEATFKFEDGSTGEIFCNFRNPSVMPLQASIVVEGKQGKLTCNNFIAPSVFHTITVTANGTSRTEKVYGSGHMTYYYQLQAFANQVLGGPPCETNAEDGVKNMRLIDRIYEKAGMMKRGLSITSDGTPTPK
eukprot:TRINITY_DN4570_c0_g1_i1.p1 TRINITY_DN4570_c0_g1~~TRINITY_DN4570_c0_g1_i1.p1  ORF type:complete len:362 (-),score=69.24 TRINITY_DN4570_c0_g1_i1:4-1089(-)